MDLLPWLVGWRAVWALLSKSYYVPDETWQSVEVAHKVVFGNGYLTWEWEQGLRSSLLPVFYALPFLLLKFLHLDFQWLVIFLPRLMAGVLTAFGDLAFLKLARRREDPSTVSWLLLLTQTNWFLLYSGSRTLSTSLETSLLLISLASYPQPRALGLAALSVMMRPTAALAWLPLAPLFCTTILPSLPFKKLLILPLAPLAALLLAAMVDSFFYGFPIFTPLNFFKANVVEDLSSFYGVQGWWWYLSHTLLPILGPLLLPALLGLPGLPAFLSLPIISTIFVFSVLPHKEMRFLHPILPLLLFSAARYLAKRLKGPPSSRATLLLFLANIPPTIYLSLLHQQGVVAAAVHLGKEKEGALVLMPCHSTPLYSHIHEDVPVRFLTCNPPLHGQPVQEEEAEVFYKAPRAWIDHNYPLNSSYPSLPGNVLLFDNLEPQVGGALRARGLQPCLSWHHTHFPEGRIGGRVLLYCRRPISHPQK